MNKKTLEKFKSVLANISISEEHKNVLNEFFSEFSETLKEKIKAQTYEEVKAELVAEGVSSINEDDITAKVDEAKATWEEEKEREISELKEVLENSFAEELTVALEELYDTIEEKVRMDFSKSKEFAVLEQIKDSVLEIVEESDVKKLADEIKQLKSEANTLKEFVNESTIKEVIDELVSDFSSKNQKILKTFLEDCSTEEEVYKTFNKVVGILEEEDLSGDDFEPSMIAEDDDYDDEEDYDDEPEEDDLDEDDLDDEEDDEEEDEDDEDEDEDEDEEDYQDSVQIKNVKNKVVFNESELDILKKAKIFNG